MNANSHSGAGIGIPIIGTKEIPALQLPHLCVCMQVSAFNAMLYSTCRQCNDKMMMLDSQKIIL